MKLLECSKEAINAAILDFELSTKKRARAGKILAEGEHLFTCEEVRAYLPVLAANLRKARTGDEQYALLFALLHMGINVGMHLAENEGGKHG